jgi:hypothetical protein
MRAREFIIENYSSKQVLKYIKAVHPRGEFTIDHVVKNYPEWELDNIEISKIKLPDEEGNEVSPYNQIYDIDYDHVSRITINDIKNKPVVLDANGWIIDGAHRVTAARELGLKSLPAYVPVIDPDEETYDQFMARQSSNLNENNNVVDEINKFLNDLTPSDVGVEEFDGYRVHFEGFTDDCKTSSDYQTNPEAVYRDVFDDFVRREGGLKPVKSDMIGDEENPILYSIFKTQLNELKIDNRDGLGAVPYNQEVGYMGLKVAMEPSMFLRLALPLNSHSPEEMKTINYIQQNIDEPGVGAPFLNIEIPEAWESGNFKAPARVVGHDGRHRMYAIMNHQGDEPVEVHMFPRYLRRRNLTDEIIEQLRNGMVGQQGNYIRGPIFGEAK